MGFIVRRATMGWRVGTAGDFSFLTPAAADFGRVAFNPQVNPEIEEIIRELLRGGQDPDPSIFGTEKIRLTFSTWFHHSGTNTTPPKNFPFFQCCTMRQQVLPDGVSLQSDSQYTNVPGSSELVWPQEGTDRKQLVVQSRGLVGTWTMTPDRVGAPTRIDFDFQGILENITDRTSANYVTPTGFDEDTDAAARPPAMKSASIQLFNESQNINNITVNAGNEVQVWTDPEDTTGLEGGHVVNRQPTTELDPTARLIADRGNLVRWKAGTTGSLQITYGTASNRLTVWGPRVQLGVDFQQSETEGQLRHSKTIRMLGNDVGDNAIRIIHGNEPT